MNYLKYIIITAVLVSGIYIISKPNEQTNLPDGISFEPTSQSIQDGTALSEEFISNLK